MVRLMITFFQHHVQRGSVCPLWSRDRVCSEFNHGLGRNFYIAPNPQATERKRPLTSYSIDRRPMVTEVLNGAGLLIGIFDHFVCQRSGLWQATVSVNISSAFFNRSMLIFIAIRKVIGCWVPSQQESCRRWPMCMLFLITLESLEGGQQAGCGLEVSHASLHNYLPQAGPLCRHPRLSACAVRLNIIICWVSN